MSPEKLVRPRIRDGTLTPHGAGRRDFENSATAAHDAIFAARFGPKRSNGEQPTMRRHIAPLENDAHFVFWHRRNRAHIGNLFGGTEIWPGLRREINGSVSAQRKNIHSEILTGKRREALQPDFPCGAVIEIVIE